LDPNQVAALGPFPGNLTNQSLTQALNAASQAAITAALDTGDPCAQLFISEASFGTSQSKAGSGYVAQADLNGDGVVNVFDLIIAAKILPSGTVCPIVPPVGYP